MLILALMSMAATPTMLPCAPANFLCIKMNYASCWGKASSADTPLFPHACTSAMERSNARLPWQKASRVGTNEKPSVGEQPTVKPAKPSRAPEKVRGDHGHKTGGWKYCRHRYRMPGRICPGLWRQAEEQRKAGLETCRRGKGRSRPDRQQRGHRQAGGNRHAASS